MSIVRLSIVETDFGETTQISKNGSSYEMKRFLMLLTVISEVCTPIVFKEEA